ncbi:hypothetical protein ACLB2K_028780 [Fragaria x ananassa]
MSRRLLYSDKYPSYSLKIIRPFKGEDRITRLPDFVLGHILSFLPSTKCVVRTSILSKRWKNIWSSVPNLYFRDEEFDCDENFIAFVDRVLSCRDPSSTLQKFHLHFNHCAPEDFYRVENWISTAARCNVVELVLAVRSSGNMMFLLPESLMTCKSLEVLRLMSVFVMDNGDALGCFPSLKRFHCHFGAENYGGLYSTTGCFHFYALEHFTIYGDPGTHFFEDLSISAPQLKTISLEFPCSPYDMHKYYNIKIDAEALEKLEIKEDSLSNFNLNNTQSLVEADIAICFHPSEDDVEDEDDVRQANEFLTAISMVKYLSLSWSFYEACSVPAFDNLIKLRLVHFGCSHWWKNLMKLLEKSPHLECLVIDDGVYPTRKRDKVTELLEKEDEVIDTTKQTKVLNWIPPKSVPNCLVSHLKTISIRGFRGKRCIGYQDEVEVTKYLLKHGRVLEKMTIYTSGRFPKKDIFKETSMIKWGSEAVQVEIIKKVLYED